MGKYDKDLAEFYDLEVDPIAYFLCKIGNELAEGNRLTRQKLIMKPGDVLLTEEAIDKA